MPKDIPEYEEMVAHVLAEFMENVPRITTENLKVGVDFEMLMCIAGSTTWRMRNQIWPG
ncbi:MAG: hypothetical protein V4614_09295 [Pseudomonadota bacterium]